MKKYIFAAISAILLIIILIIGFNIYSKKMTEINTKKFKNYINNNFNTDSSKSTYYQILSNNYILTKITKFENSPNSLVSISYNKKNEILGELKLYGKNKYGNEGISYLKSTYKNNKFTCDFVSNNGYKARCDILKKKTEELKKEMKDIIKNSKVKIKYLKTK